MASSVATNSVFSSSRPILVPALPELHDPNFLDVLLPAAAVDAAMDVDRADTPTPSNPMIDALKATVRQTFTANGAPAYTKTDSPLLNAFTGMSRYTFGRDVERYLEEAWKEDANMTVRLIWNLRSIHDGKGEREVFYRAFGWLYDNHPRTAISNLHLLVEPVCEDKKKKMATAHGYWKDLLNILALATVDELSNISGPSKFLHAPRSPYTYPRSKPRNTSGTPESRVAAALEVGARAKVAAAAERKVKATQNHERLVRKLADSKFRALYIAVARLYADQLAKDIKILDELQSLPAGSDNKTVYRLLKKISLAGKWAPTPGQSHDKVTNIATVIPELLFASQVITQFPSRLKQTSAQVDENTRAHILRSFYQRWVLTELRRAIACPEPLMSANRWAEIKYNRVPSVCMKTNTELFFKHDPKGFEEYLISVESGKMKISGATLLPHELVAQAMQFGNALRNGFSRDEKFHALKEAKEKLAETQIRVVEAQWKTLIANLRDSGSIENSIAVCDVSGSMGSLGVRYHKNDYYKNEVQPILPAISLSLVLASLASPPFNGGFITFSSNPKFQMLNLKKPLFEQIEEMSQADWGMNTDLSAVFLKLLLPLAIKNEVKQEDMIKRLFIFSDMQFDECNAFQPVNHGNSGFSFPTSWPNWLSGGSDASEPVNSGFDLAASRANGWKTNYDVIKEAYKHAGYEVPQIVYWDLAATGVPRTKEVEESTREGVAMMNGFSPSMLKVFMGEDAGEDEWEKVGEEGESETVAEKDAFNPVIVMKKALGKKSFDGLVVLD